MLLPSFPLLWFVFYSRLHLSAMFSSCTYDLAPHACKSGSLGESHQTFCQRIFSQAISSPKPDSRVRMLQSIFARSIMSAAAAARLSAIYPLSLELISPFFSQRRGRRGLVEVTTVPEKPWRELAFFLLPRGRYSNQRCSDTRMLIERPLEDM